MQAGSFNQLRKNLGRAQIGEQAQFLAQAQNGLLRTLGARQLVVLPTAHGAEQDGVGFASQLQRGRGQWITRNVVSSAAYRRLLDFQLEAVFGQRAQHFDRLRNDFRADAVTGEYCNFHYFTRKNI